MRKFGKLDSNHERIRDALRKTGHSVMSLASIGNGCADLLVGRNGVNCLLEVKNGAKPPSQRKLTPDEILFRDGWKGQYAVVKDEFEAINEVNRCCK